MGIEMPTHVLAKIPPFYGCKVALHAGYQHVASLADILLATCLASDAIHQIGTLASDIGLAVVCQPTATASNVKAIFPQSYIQK